MLRQLRSNKDSFTPIVFRPGFNAILADQAANATQTDSRNARGKTTTLQIINYCLGGNLHPSLRPLAEDDWVFTLDLDLFGGWLSVSRSVRSSTRLSILCDQAAQSIVGSYLDEDSNISVADWKFLLGLGLFGLDAEAEDSHFRLSPRTLLSYAVRLDALKDPFKVIPQQPAWSSREHVAFLLGLDWRLVRDLTIISKEEEAYKALRYASAERLIPGIFPDESDLVLERAQAGRQVEELDGRIHGFRVIDDPDNIIRRADQLTERLRILRNQSLTDRRLLELYRRSIDDAEADQSRYSIADLYADLGRSFTSLGVSRKLVRHVK